MLSACRGCNCGYIPGGQHSVKSRLRPFIATKGAHQQQQHRLRAALVAPQEAADQLTPLNNLFEDICNYHDIKAPVKLHYSKEGSGIGLFAVNSIAKGETILRVPRSLCIILDNDNGSLSIPKGDWPRLTGGIMQETALTWDMLMALALMDATAGNGDQFWELYSDHFLQQPEDLTLPMCWHDDLLQELQHTDIITAAQQQQERLRTLLPPEYMQPIDQGLPSYLQWGFANVRSRALQLGPQAFGMVPFIDIANHAADPNADVRAPPPPPAAAAAASSDESSADQGFVDLYAVQDIAQGDEVTISYSGLSGYTNQRFMAQYGFVPAQGNAADRLQLDIPQSHAETKFRMSYLEDALGSQLLMEAAKGKNPCLIAAMKSLPLIADQPDPAAAADAGGRGLGPATQQEQQLATVLLQQVQQELQSSRTTLQEDKVLLQQLQGSAAAESETDAGGLSDVVVGDGRLAAAVKYRIERKKLLQAASVLLNIFVRE